MKKIFLKSETLLQISKTYKAGDCAIIIGGTSIVLWIGELIRLKKSDWYTKY